MRNGYAVIGNYGGIVDTVTIFVNKEDADKCLFKMVKRYVNEESKGFRKFLTTESQNSEEKFTKFLTALDTDDIEAALQIYDWMLHECWNEDDEFLILDCEIFD